MELCTSILLHCTYLCISATQLLIFQKQLAHKTRQIPLLVDMEYSQHLQRVYNNVTQCTLPFRIGGQDVIPVITFLTPYTLKSIEVQILSAI